VAYSKFLRARYIAHSGQVGKQELAEQLLNEVLEIEPDFIPALEALATVYFGQSEDERLIRGVIARISALEPDGVAGLRAQASFADYFDNDPVMAAPLYQRALALDPGDLRTLLFVSGFLRRVGRIEEAIKTYEYITLRDPACIYCLMGLSLTYRTTDRNDRAIEILQEAVA
jgi:tetratricopeptide (TPR) repeat protein